jgi:LPS sulfotransferase NodH
LENNLAKINFVIISTQRSGSTLLRTSLDSHPQIRCLGEVFLPTYKQEHSYYEYLKSKGTSKTSAFLRKSALVYEHLDHLYGGYTTNAAGFKVMYDQIGDHRYGFPMVLRYIRGNDVRVIHLVRENSLNTCISKQFARATRTYHTDDSSAQTAMAIDIPKLIREIRSVEKGKSRWRAILDGDRCLELSYEDFVDNKQAASRRLLDFLEVDSSVQLNSPLKKVLTAPLTESVLNYTELKSALTESGFVGFLDS